MDYPHRMQTFKIYFQILFQILVKVKHIFIIQLLILVMYKGSDQVQDLFLSLLQEPVWGLMGVFMFGILIFSLQSWNSARLLLETSDFEWLLVEPEDNVVKSRAIRSFSKVLPRFLGFVPFVLAFLPAWQVKGDLPDSADLLWFGIWLLVGAVLYFSIYTGKYKLIEKLYPEQASQIFTATKTEVQALDRVTVILSYVLLILTVPVFLVGITPGLAVLISPYVGTLALVQVFFAGLVLFFSWLAYYDSEWQWPVTIFVFIYVFACSAFNNNHHIRTQEASDGKKYERLALGKYYYSWKAANHITPQDTLYLVAAEGGGIRAAYWTALVLDELSKTVPRFSDRLFALSGVSGGTVGSAFYLAHEADKKKSTPVQPGSVTECLKSDFLSPLVASFLGSDFFQLFSPFPFGYDRAVFLEKAWEEGYNQTFKSNTLAEPMGALYAYHSLPLLFSNSTVVQNGQRAIYAPVKLGSSKGTPFDSILDVGENLTQPVSLSTVALMSARFPYVTPGGRFFKGNRPLDLVDGGYFENSGLATALIIRDVVQGIESYRPVRIIFIRNGLTNYSSGTGNLGHELITPANAFINAWDKKTDMIVKQTKLVIGAPFTDFIEIRLPRSKEKRIPLGWALSRNAAQLLDEGLRNDTVQKRIASVR